jgi:hypothetical protein
MRALRSGRDVWGGELLRARGGPTLAAAKTYLPPLLLARGPKQRPLTRSGVYYLPFADPPAPGGTSAVHLHVADGGELLARRTGGASLGIFAGDERYGSCLARLRIKGLAEGWLPVLETSYTDARGNRFQQESFATRFDGALASLVELQVDPRTDVDVRLAPSGFAPLTLHAEKGAPRTLTIAWTPNGVRTIDFASYVDARREYVERWRTRVASGATFDVPEREIADARRALLAQNLLLGWRYSIGNPYEELSFPEAPDVAQVLAEIGYRDDARAILETSLHQRAQPYANWKRGEKLYVYATYYRLTRDRAGLEKATPVLASYVAALSRAMHGGILARERFSSDIPDRVYGFHAQTVAWAGLRAIAGAWSATGHADLAARSRTLATRLERGLQKAVASSERRLPDGTLFVPARLLDRERPYGSLVEARAGSYWNLVMPFGFATGFLTDAQSRGAFAYMQAHGSRLLGLVRAGAYALYGRDAPFPVSGTDEVYGVNVARFLADLDRPDQLVLSLYGELAAAMTPRTYVAGEGASVAPLPGSRYRAMYLPPNSAANAAFLETLRVMLVHETRDGLELAFATPRGWLQPGKTITVSNVPTGFGLVSYSLAAERGRVRVQLQIPGSAHVRVRLRLPDGRRVTRVTSSGRAVALDRATGTIDLAGRTGGVELQADVS